MTDNLERILRWKIIDGVKSKGTERAAFLIDRVQKREEKY